MKISTIGVYLLSFPKSLILNLKIFDIKTALKLPVFIRYNTIIKGAHKGVIRFENPSDIKPATVKISMDRGSIVSGGYRKIKSALFWGIGGVWYVSKSIIFNGSCTINVHGELYTGKNFSAGPDFTLSCSEKITFGDNNLIGWGVTVIDSDGHDIILETMVTNKPKEIVIGKNNWICAKCCIFKGAHIGDHSVVGFGTYITKDYAENNCLIIGNPGKIVRYGIAWKP